MNRLHQAIQQANGRPVLGAALYFYDPIFLEIAAHMGFKAIWIEMEHAAITFAQAGDLCRMASGAGLLTMIRIPDARRETVLKAAECGPDIIDLPMANSAEDMAELVRYSRFFPEGERGVWSGSRALNYGLVESMPQGFEKVNAELSLLAQIETVEALDRIEQLAAIPGVDLFIGPADLSASMGIPWQTGHPKVLEAAARIVSVARSNGKKVATSCGPADFIHWARLGIDLLFCTNDIACLRIGAKQSLQAAVNAIDQAASES